MTQTCDMAPAAPAAGAGQGKRAARQKEYVAPRNAAESAIADLWSELLEVERVGALDNFFQLGGHSLLVAQLLSRLRERLGLEVPALAFFRQPTVERLAELAGGATAAAPGAPVGAAGTGSAAPGGSGPGEAADLPAPPPLVRVPRDGRLLPLSYAQERIFLLDQLAAGGNLAYNFQVAMWLHGPLDAAVLAGALTEIVRRHEVLRTAFPAPGGQPMQVIEPPFPVTLPLADLSGLPEERRPAVAEALIVRLVRWAFDLSRAPLIRWRLLRLRRDLHVLVQVEHHFVHDGWSLAVLLRELDVIYGALARGEAPRLPELAVQYADFACWQRQWLEGEAMTRLLAHAERQLAGAPPPVEVASDRPRPRVCSFVGEVLMIPLAPDLYERLRHYSRSQGVTLYMTMLAGFLALLARLSGREDLLLGTSNANRRMRELEPMLGMMVASLVLRADLSGRPSFATLLGRARELALDTFAHQDLPFQRLVQHLRAERPLGQNPLFEVMFSFHDAPVPEPRLGELDLVLDIRANRTAKMDLNVIVLPRAEQRAGRREAAEDRSAILRWEYSTDLYDTATMRRMIAQYQTLLAGAAAAPGLTLAALPLLSPAETAAVQREWNDTEAAAPREAGLAELFARQAAAAPDAVAVALGGERWSYGEVDRRAGRLARLLRARGAGAGDLVALAAERSAALVPLLLAILKTGAAYLPLDPAHPAERLRRMLAESGARLVVAPARLLPLLGTATVSVAAEELMAAAAAGDAEPAAEPRRGVAAAGAVGAAAAAASGEEAVGAATGPARATVPGAGPAGGVGGDAIAYVMYTSGTTGQPKGVAVTHRGVVRLVHGGGYAHCGPGEVFLQLAPLSFDASTFELWGALLHGGCLVLHPEAAPSLDTLAAVLRDEGVTTLWLTAGLFHQVVDERPAALRPLRQLLAGGDVLSPPHVARALAALPGLTLINGYGPTEGTTFSCCQPLGGGAAAATAAAGREREAAAAGARLVPIGRAIGNTRAYVIGREMELLPAGMPGELLVGGDGLALGYLHQPAPTAERFIPDPFGAPGGRLYRTGDLARWHAEGTLEFLGRNDRQVKIRGFRVEPAEVEAALAELPQVAAACVLAERSERGERGERSHGGAAGAASRPEGPAARLVAYVVPAAAAPPGASAALPVTPTMATTPVTPVAPATPATLAPSAASAPPAAGGTAARRSTGVAFAEQLREELRRRLPEPFVPAVFVEVPALPLTPNGKIDRRALAALRQAAGGASASSPSSAAARAADGTAGAAAGALPEAPAEELLAAVWAEALGVERVGAEDDFFALGGDSLLAFRVCARISSAFGVQVTLPAIFEAPTPAAMARVVGAAAERPKLPPLVRVRRDRPLPLSFPQQRLWFMQRMEPASSAYHISRAYRLAPPPGGGPAPGPGAPPVVAAALRRLAERHETLRTRFVSLAGQAVQRVAPEAAVPLLVIDLTALAPAAVARATAMAAAAVCFRPFDLEAAVPMRACLVQGGGGEGGEDLLLLCLHHIAADGWSMRILERELTALLSLAVNSANGATVTGGAAAASGADRARSADSARSASDAGGVGGADAAAAAVAAAAAALPPLPFQYGDFAAWQRGWLKGPVLRREIDAWRRRLAGAPSLIELPADRSRPAVRSFRGGQVRWPLPAASAAALDRLGRRLGATRFMVALAVFDLLLARHGAGDDFLVGTPIANRGRHETDDLIGFFVNILALRADLAGATDFAALLARVRATALDAYAHQDMPFERLVEELRPDRNLGHTPLVQVVLAVEEPLPVPPPPLRPVPLPVAAATTKFDLVLTVAGLAGGAGACDLVAEYSADLFDPATVRRLVSHFGVLLAGAAAAPGARLPELPLLGAGERWQLLAEWNAGLPQVEVGRAAAGSPHPGQDGAATLATLPALIAARAAAAPTALALRQDWAGDRQDGRQGAEVRQERDGQPAQEGGEEPAREEWRGERGERAALELTYGELESRSRLLARRLRRLGVAAESVVAVLADRAAATIVAQLGVLRAGAAYLPLDPAVPHERLRFMVEDAGAALMLAGRGAAPHLCGLGEAGVAVLPLDDLLAPDTLDSPDIPDTADARDAANATYGPDGEGKAVALPEPAPESLAYVIYTSGSTGRPKGVAVSHRALRNLVDWHLGAYGLTPTDRTTQVAAVSFDAAVWEVWPSLAAGASLHLPDESTRLAPAALRDWLSGQGITVSFLPTPLAESVIGLPWPAECALRLLLTGGDRLRHAPPEGLPFRLVNHYGPTEATVVAAAGEAAAVPAQGDAVPGQAPAGALSDRPPTLGRPIGGLRVHLLDADGQPVPAGVRGEICIGGAGVARGYLGRADLTAERFVPDPFPGLAELPGGGAGGRLYRTGDLARVLGNGELDFLGRNDHQVKIRGFRIELAEVEAVLAAHPAVQEAVAAKYDAGGGLDELVAWYVPRDGERPDPEQLRRHLEGQLPSPAVPSVLVELAALPLTAHGKVDRAALPLPQRVRAAAGPVQPPRNDLERLLASWWQELLRRPEVGIDDNFFDLGGHSLLVAQLHGRLQETLARSIPIVDLFRHPTIRGLAEQLGDVPDAVTLAAGEGGAAVGSAA